MDVVKPRRSRRWRRILWISAAAVAVAIITIAVGTLRADVPVVSRSTVLTGTVQRGEMLREVRGQGTLVPMTTRLITAETQGRVERILVAPGDHVEAGTVLVELSNSDLELRALEVKREVATARTDLAALQATLASQRLGLEAEIAVAEGDLADATRRGRIMEKMNERGVVADLEKDDAVGHAGTLAAGLAFSKRRLVATTKSMRLQIEARRSEIERLEELVAFTHKRVTNLAVTAREAGVIQEVPILTGQTVVVGQLLAKIVDPTRLKAELRIAETQIKDIANGLRAVVDTRNGRIQGHVVRIDPASIGGTIKIDIALEGVLPAGARPDLSVEGVVQIERLEHVLFIGRPAFGETGSQISLFVIQNGDEGVRGRSSSERAR